MNPRPFFKNKRQLLPQIFSFLISLIAFTSLAQDKNEMSIVSFKWDEADQTAMMAPTMRSDLNGDKCALIKIATTQKGFSFDVGSLGVTEVETQNSTHPGEIWLYVPKGVFRITIQHPIFGIIKDFDLGQRLQPGRTYTMELTSNQVNTIVLDYANKQNLRINVFPPDARVFINGIRQDMNEKGFTSIEIPFGNHTYRVEADNYYPEEKQFTINEAIPNPSLSVSLKQNFGYLNLLPPADDNKPEGNVFIDDVLVGQYPLYNYLLKSGSHKVTVKRNLYLPYTETIIMTDSANVSLLPKFESNFANYDIIVDGDIEAIIYDNGEVLGIGSWSGPLAAGTHEIIVTKESYRPQSMKIEVFKDVPRKISIPRPLPIYGGIEVITNPPGATVFIDGIRDGVSNYTNPHLVVGTYHIKLEKPGFKTEEFDVTIHEDKTEVVTRTLTDFCDITIFSDPIAAVSINGKETGRTPYHLRGEAGEYDIRISSYGYTTYSKKVRLDGNSTNMTIKLYRNYIRNSEFYVQVGYNLLTFPGINAGAGFYFNNVNLEANYLLGFTNSPEIFWSDRNGNEAPVAATYKPSGFNIKTGYGIRIHNRIRITPQLGFRYVSLKESIKNIGDTDPSISNMSIDNSAYAGSLSVGARFNVAFAPWAGIALNPEYIIGVKQSPGFKALADISSKIKNYSQGFNLNLSLYVFF